MQYQIIAFILICILMIIAGCNFHLHNNRHRFHERTRITLSSYDPYGPLTRAIHAELHLNNVIIVKNADTYNAILPSLRILNASESQVTTSVFQDGKTAEYQLTLMVQAQVFMPEKDYYPIDVKIHRSFFDNPLTTLAKDAEGELIRQEMRQQAARQLVDTLFSVCADELTDNAPDVKLHQQQDFPIPQVLQ